MDITLVALLLCGLILIVATVWLVTSGTKPNDQEQDGYFSDEYDGM